MGVTRYLGICASPDCGKTYSALDADSQLRSFLIGDRPSQPYASPWLRAFLAAARIPNTEGWQPTGAVCWSCQESDLTLRFCFRPTLTPESVVLCLHCGALDAQFIYGSTYNRLLGGDWTGLTGPVLAFRQAIRQGQARADDGHDEDMEGLWND
jgi:hypothetical protein